MTDREPTLAPDDAAEARQTGPVPQGAPPEGAPPPDGGPSPSGASPSGHPSGSVDAPVEELLESEPPLVDGALVEERQPDPVDEIDLEVDEAYQTMVDDLARLAAERQDYLDQLLRTRADFENYRKRILKQQTEHLERAAEGLVGKLLDVLDVFDAAMAHGQGFDQAYGKLLAVLEKEGLERIDPAGAPFDPNESDAVAHEEADGEAGPVVSEVLRAGYRWKGRVVRPAMVKVRG